MGSPRMLDKDDLSLSSEGIAVVLRLRDSATGSSLRFLDLRTPSTSKALDEVFGFHESSRLMGGRVERPRSACDIADLPLVEDSRSAVSCFQSGV